MKIFSPKLRRERPLKIGSHTLSQTPSTTATRRRPLAPATIIRALSTHVELSKPRPSSGEELAVILVGTLADDEGEGPADDGSSSGASVDGSPAQLRRSKSLRKAPCHRAEKILTSFMFPFRAVLRNGIQKMSRPWTSLKGEEKLDRKQFRAP